MEPLLVDLSRRYRGGQHQALLLLQGLRDRGHAPELLAVRGSLLALQAKEAGVSVHTVNPAWRRLGAAWRIRRLLRERPVKLVHANEPHALTSAWLARVHRVVPLIVSRRIALPLPAGVFALSRYRAAARVIGVSRFVEQSVLRSGLPAARVALIYDGVRIPPEISPAERDAARGPLGLSGNVPCIANVAAFLPEKGHALLLDAFAKLRAEFPTSRLLLRGDGPELPNTRALAGRLQLLDAVKILPPEFALETLFAATDVFAFPSLEEPLGSALLAAMAHGLPVVAVARGGIPEIVEDGKNGLLVTNLDSGSLASAVARLLSHPEEAKTLGKAGRETVTSRFSASHMVEETLRLYEHLVSRDLPAGRQVRHP